MGVDYSVTTVTKDNAAVATSPARHGTTRPGTPGPRASTRRSRRLQRLYQ